VYLIAIAFSPLLTGCASFLQAPPLCIEQKLEITTEGGGKPGLNQSVCVGLKR
jgi:hypothetical protein